jgi:hypothetical protein
MKAIKAALLAITLVGCGATGGTQDEAWARNNVRAITDQMNGQDGDTVLYLNIIAEEYPNIITEYGEDWVVEFGENVCGSIDGGWTWSDIKALNTTRPDLEEAIAYMVAAAVAIFCPEHGDALFS